jgi:hypothetical protein
MRYLPALFLLFLSCSLFAQMDHNQLVLKEYVSSYNAQRASRDWAKTEVTNVQFSIDENNTLVAFLGDGELRIDLDRDEDDPMDVMFPLSVPNTRVVFTNATILFIDPAGEHHFAFSVLDEPDLPVLADGYITLFKGLGLGRRSAVE